MIVDVNKLDELEALLAKATPGLMQCNVRQMAGLIKRGAETQKPRARDWDRADYESDAAAIRGALSTAPDLIATIRAQTDEIAKLSAENERLSKAVASGVLGTLLEDDETQALHDFIKYLRASKELS